MAEVLITGTGLIGAELASAMKQEGHQVRFLSQSKTEYQGFPCYHWNVDNEELDDRALDSVDHIIHLAGAGIADKKWSKERKRILIDSRAKSAKLLHHRLELNDIRIKSYISASGIGYYGAITSDKIFQETDKPGDDFASKICVAWEDSARLFNNRADQVLVLRLGIVLSQNGGALDKLIPLFKYYLGSPIGTGKQYMPWIHINDVIGAVLYSIKNKLNGTYNLVADEHVTNSAFSRILAKGLNKDIILPRVPSAIIKLRFGELSSILLHGSRVSNEKFKATGYHFQFNLLKSALKSILK